MLTDNEKIIKEELDAIVSDIKSVYEASGKKTSGEFANQLEVKTGRDSGALFGVTYLAGRGAGKMPPVARIEEWVRQKGIFQIESDAQATGIAWAIAKKIAKEGTAKEYHLKIYEQVITPQRIQKIIDRVSQVNVQDFVNSVVVELELLVKDV